MPATHATIRIPARFEGPTAQGQGGWTAAKFAAEIGEPVSVALRAPVPLDTDLDVVASEDSWHLFDATPASAGLIMEASRAADIFASTEPVTLAAAVRARARFDRTGDQHPAPHCFSCGVGANSMAVHAGPLGDGRYATDWTVPAWSVAEDGSVDVGVLWAALDCTAAWYVSSEHPRRMAFTVQYSVEVIHPPVAGETYAIVGWHGHDAPEWDGRKRGAASAAFDHTGECVARARSFWISAD